MNYEDWHSLIGSEEFWGGVLTSLFATILLSIIAFIFRNSIRTLSKNRKQIREENQIFDNALNISNKYAPFSFGVVQSRAIRYFVLAVFIAYIGDILGLFWPTNIIVYCFSLLFLFQSLRWLYKLEKRAMEILKNEIN